MASTKTLLDYNVIHFLIIALPLFEGELSQMSKPEQNFGVGWANIVGFIAACFFETNFNNTSKQQKILLPPRVLHTGDNPPYIPGNHLTRLSPQIYKKKIKQIYKIKF